MPFCIATAKLKIERPMTEDRFNSRLLLTTTEVADLLAVHPSTVKRWCNEGDLPFEKTEGGHRRIHLKDTLDFSESREIPTFLDDFSPYEGHVWTALQEVLSAGSFQRVLSLSLSWLVRGQWDRVGKLLVMLGTHPSVPLPLFCDEALQGLMEEVGSAWRRGEIRIGEEHIASQVVTEALLRMRIDGEVKRPDDAPARPLAVVGAMEGDLHHIGALCIRVLLERMGWRVAYLGGDVPVEEFSAIQRSQGASLVCVSFSPPHTVADMNRCVRILSEFYREDQPHALALGGGIFREERKPEFSGPFPATGVFSSAAEFVSWVRGLEPAIATALDDGGDEWMA
jgi:excisionase family DNA binding protein